ncbi:MAG: hypothetical protein O2856_13490 [Planctomycetota bacterium]|nr:hypothetical protein [Planctomycetota bacterium]
MSHSSDDPTQHKQVEILFRSEFGGYPKYALYGFLPLLLLVAGGLMIYAIGFNGGMNIKGLKVSPAVVAYGICPVIFLMCVVVIGSEIYRRFHPQRIVITERGLVLPKGRFTNEVIHIRWNDLTATLTVGSIAVLDVYDVACINSTRRTKVNISSPLFRRFDDFAAFALIIGEFMGEDWSIKGFLPGAVRGSQQLARQVSQRIEYCGDD